MDRFEMLTKKYNDFLLGSQGRDSVKSQEELQDEIQKNLKLTEFNIGNAFSLGGAGDDPNFDNVHFDLVGCDSLGPQIAY